MSDAAPSAAPGSSTELQVPISHVVNFVRQLSHDLRNHLNAAELQAAYLKEIAEGDEMKEEVQRLRAIVSALGGSLQKLTTALSPVKLTTMDYEASALVEDLRHKVTQQWGEQAGAFGWDVKAVNATLEIDPQLLQQALLELFGNALEHGRGSGAIAVEAEAKGNRFRLTWREPKSVFAGSTSDWGREPFKLAKHGHYSLGLHRARNIIEAHGGELAARYEPEASLLVTTVSLPISDARS